MKIVVMYSGAMRGICENGCAVQKPYAPVYLRPAGCGADSQPDGEEAFHGSHERGAYQSYRAETRLPFRTALSSCYGQVQGKRYPAA